MDYDDEQEQQPRWAQPERPDSTWIRKVLEAAIKRTRSGPTRLVDDVGSSLQREVKIFPDNKGAEKFSYRTVRDGVFGPEKSYGIVAGPDAAADSLAATDAFRVVSDARAHQQKPMGAGAIASEVNDYLGIHRRPKKLPSLAPRDATRRGR